MHTFLDIINSPYLQGALSFGSGSTYIYVSLKSNCLVLFNYTKEGVKRSWLDRVWGGVSPEGDSISLGGLLAILHG